MEDVKMIMHIRIFKFQTEFFIQVVNILFCFFFQIFLFHHISYFFNNYDKFSLGLRLFKTQVFI